MEACSDDALLRLASSAMNDTFASKQQNKIVFEEPAPAGRLRKLRPVQDTADVVHPALEASGVDTGDMW